MITTKSKQRRMIQISGIAEAIEPILHGGDRSGGTVTEFRREKMRLGDHFEYMPVVSANSIAGLLRDHCAFWCLDQIEFSEFRDLRAFDLLTGGGSLSKSAKSEKYVDLYEEQELRALFPVIILFGASVGNRIIGGRIDVERWLPLCAELIPALPAEHHTLAAKWHIEELLQEVNFTRRDDKKNRAWQDYIAPDVLSEHQRGKEEHAKNEESDEAGQSTSMRYGFEALAAGTLFSVGWTLRNPTDAELGVFFGGLSYFYERPKIGGRGARGFGRVKLDLHQYLLTGPARVEHPLAIETMQTASEQLQARKSTIEQILQGGL